MVPALESRLWSWGPVKLKEIDKFADGIAVQKVGQLTHEATRKNVETLIGVDEGLIWDLIDLYSKQGIVAEPAGAASSLEVLSDYNKARRFVVSFLEEITISTECQRWKNALIYDGIYFVVNFPITSRSSYESL